MEYLPVRKDGENSIYIPSAQIGLVARVVRPNGAIRYYRKSNGEWSGAAGNTETLSEVLDGSSQLTGYKYTTLDDTVELYNANGILQSITDVKGNTQTLGYDAQGRLSTVTNDINQSLTFGYDASNRISTMTDQAGRVWQYGYDANNNLASIIYPDATSADNTDNPERVYLYENSAFPHALTSITDCAHVVSCSTVEANHYTNFEYDSTGRTTASYHGPETPVLSDRIDGVSIIYNPDGTRTVTNSRNYSSTYSTVTQQGVVLPTQVTGPSCGCGGQ